MQPKNNTRNRELAAINMLAQRLNALGEEAETNLLIALAGKRTASELTEGEAWDVIRFLGGNQPEEVIQA